MTIPHDDTIQSELLTLISKKESGSISVSDAYKELALLHPEITEEEKTKRYENSKSKWANRVQFARLHLVRKGLIYRFRGENNQSYGYWEISEKGKDYLKNRIKDTLSDQIIQDIDSLSSEESLPEGGIIPKLIAYYERNSKLRSEAIKIHGATCKACGFNFKDVYGPHGDNFIEVHHLIKVSTLVQESMINPRSDMTVLCSNCHRMIHRDKNNPISVDQLIHLLKSLDAIKTKAEPAHDAD